jgi:hypothetical protein
MEKAAAAGVGAGDRWGSVLGCCAALVAAAWCPAVQADEPARPPAEVLVAQAKMEPRLRLQVQTTSLPRFDAQDSGFQGPRVDVSVTPFNASGSGLGAVVGLASPSGAPMGLQSRATSVDLGLRWSQRLQNQHRVDITAWRRMNTPDDAYSLIQMNQPVYGARVEMNLSAKTRKTGFALDRGFIGLQLQSGARITIKRRNGHPMVYYRTIF